MFLNAKNKAKSPRHPPAVTRFSNLAYPWAFALSFMPVMHSHIYSFYAFCNYPAARHRIIDAGQ